MRPSALRAAILALTWLWTAAEAASEPAAQNRIEPLLNEDGLYSEPWFLESFLDLGQDLAEAAAKGKRLAVIWEQRGCSYCRDTHTINFADPEISNYVRENFEIVQLNLHGAREVTDFDGELLPEKALARKWGVLFTPTIIYFPADPKAAEGQSGRAAEVARMPGYFRPFTFLSMFQYVREADLAATDFQSFLAERLARRRAAGQAPAEW